MKRISSFALAAVTLVFSASLVLAQGGTAPTTGTTAAKPAGSAMTTKVKTSATGAATSARSAATNTKGAAGAVTTGNTGAAATQAKGAATNAGAATGQAKVAGGAAASMVDLNSAPKADLMKLPGVGEAISDKIIKARPFANKSQLVSRGIVGQKAYDKFSGMVVAKQPAMKK